MIPLFLGHFFFSGSLFFFLFIWLCWVFIAAHRLSLVAVHGLLIAVASLVADHRLCLCFNSCSMRAQWVLQHV